MKKIGVDIGGTFTDLVLLDDQGNLNVYKTPSTPANLAEGVFAGITALESDFRKLDLILHGTTVATNAILERKGAKTGLITTKGFRDILEIRRGFRHPPLYDLTVELPPPLSPRELRMEVGERLDYTGKVIQPLDLEEVKECTETLKAKGVEAIAVCLLFSYNNSDHEQSIKRVINELFPECYVSCSSDILPVHREYERTSVTVINAYLGPKASHYIKFISDELKNKGYAHDFLLMRSSGGVMSETIAREQPATLVESGPVAGVVASQQISKLAGFGDVITLDIGGTSCDVGIIAGGDLVLTKDKIYSYQLSLPMVDVTSIGCGGGSVAWVDKGGALQVGPQSQGADPGPACYDQGGKIPTLCDASVLLGYLNPDNFLGGRMKLKPELSKEAIATIAKPLKMDTTEASIGICKIAVANMGREVHLRIVEHGYDPRDFVLFPIGGAGPIFASQIASDINIKRVLVPVHPGVVSAMGCLFSDLMYDFTHSFIAKTQDVASNTDIHLRFNQLLEEMEESGRQRLLKEGLRENDISVVRWADMRYIFQTHEIKVDLPLGSIGPAEIEVIEENFHANHERLYTFRTEKDPIEFVEVYVAVIGNIPKPSLPLWSKGRSKPSKEAITGTREVFFESTNKFITAQIYDRPKLKVGNRIEGPAIVEEMDSTTVILPEQTAAVDSIGNIIINI